MVRSQAHLAVRAARIAATSVGMWKKLTRFAASEPTFTPPDHPVRMVKVGFAATQSPRLNPWTMAKLVFDSLNQPLTAGMRSGPVGITTVDVRRRRNRRDLVLDTRPQSGTISLVGQVVDKGGTKVAPRQVSVTLWTETGQPVAETAANEFGEFQLEFTAQTRLRLVSTNSRPQTNSYSPNEFERS